MPAEFADEFFAVELDVGKHFADGVAADDFLDRAGAVFVDGDVHRICVAQQVVQVAENFLVGADEECADVVLLAGVLVQFESFLHVAVVDELVDLAVGVAGDISKDAAARRLFLQAMNRHDGEELLDRPRVGHRLEEGEVAEVGVGELGFEAFEVITDIVSFLEDLEDFPADAPEEFFGEGAEFEGEVAEVEEVEGFVALLDGVVVDLLEVFLGDFAVGIEEVADRLRNFLTVPGFGEALGDLEGIEAGDAEHVEDQDAVVSDHRASGFGNNVRMLHAGFIANALDAEDDIAGVFLQRE